MTQCSLTFVIKARSILKSGVKQVLHSGHIVKDLPVFYTLACTINVLVSHFTIVMTMAGTIKLRL